MLIAVRWMLVGTFLSVGGCAYNPLLPDLRTASDRAREVAPLCARLSEAVDAEALSPSIVVDVGPWYKYVASGNDRRVRLRGAQLHVQAKPNLSAEVLQLSLECHQARVMLGSARELEHDPYVFPDTWLDIDTHSAGDSFVVGIQVDDMDKARAVLARARQFVASRR